MAWFPTICGPRGGQVLCRFGFRHDCGLTISTASERKPWLTVYHGFRLVDHGCHSQHLFCAFERLGYNSGAYPLPYFSTFVVHMIVGFLVGLSISDVSGLNSEIGLSIGGTVRSNDLVQLHTRVTFLEFTRSPISDINTSMPLFNRRLIRPNHD